MTPARFPPATRWTTGGGPPVSVNGFLATQNNFMIDGMDNNEALHCDRNCQASIEAIGEIKVITNNTFGRAFTRERRESALSRRAGPTTCTAALRVLPQPGAGRAPAAAPLHFAQAAYRQNNFGGSVDGPIKKNRHSSSMTGKPTCEPGDSQPAYGAAHLRGPGNFNTPRFDGGSGHAAFTIH